MAQHTRTTNASTGGYTDGLVVFLTGVPVSKPSRVDAWLPVFLAMPRMLANLSKDPGSGLLRYRLVLGDDGPLVIQDRRDRQSL